MRIRRSTLIGTAVAMALFGRGAGAQTAQPATATKPADDSALEEVVVTGIRASLRESLQTKRDATAFVDAITAEDVGKFPDKNLAESLQRIPGVTINREFGEGERVNLRGTAANLTRTLFNGHSLATADWFILDQLSATRSFNYLMLPSDLIGKVNVYKSPQADLEEGGIGGLIDVLSRNPLDMKANSFFGSIQAAHADLADKTDPNASALYSWKNGGETLGVLVAGTYQKRHLRRDGVEVLGYFDGDPGPATLQVPSLIGSALFTQERIRKGGNISVQFKPSDAVDMNLSALYSKFEGENLNENFIGWGTRAIGNGGTLSNTTVVQDTAVAGHIASLNNGTSDFGMVYDAIHRFASADTRSIDFDTKVQPTEDWGLHFKIGYTDAEGNTDAQPFAEFGAPASFDYDLRGRTPSVHFDNLDPNDPSEASLIFSSLHQILNNDDEKYAYADAERTLDLGPLQSIKFGAKYTDHKRELIFNATTYGGFHVPINGTPGTVLAGGPTPGNYLSTIAGSGTLTSYWQVDTSKLDSFLFANLASGPGRVTYPQQNFSVQEKATAGYVMANLKGDRWRGNVGVRVVRTKQEAIGALINPGGSVTNPFGNFDPLDVSRTYTDVLPSFNVVYDLQDDLLMRFAVAKVMARPDYTDVAPRVNLNIGALSGTAGNPDLDPYRANQADLSIEWYPDSNTSVAFAIYYKDIKSFITDRPVTEVFPIQGAISPNLACTPAGTQLFNCPFTINLRSNGGGGSIKGAELAVTKPIYAGFGVQANYTYADAKADNGDPLPQSSKHQANLSGYFENERLSARLSYTYRSEFFLSFDRLTPLNEKALSSLDASVSVNVTDFLALTFDGVNLTNEKIEQFAGEEFRPRAIYDNGRIYFAGVRFKF
ncbi:MAG TPA: TonB-dependent receptor [Steroidobacteraceae bacterium]|nr:TonB-dependent receptor [Steroidobacteraceae bacterium]